jgi:hypothetical protein
VTIAAKIEATGAPPTAWEPQARPIHRPDLGLDSGTKEVNANPDNALTVRRG